MNAAATTPKRTPPHLTRVVRTEDISPAIRRVVLAGESLKIFPANRNGAHIKVFLPLPGQNKPVLPHLDQGKVVWPPDDVRPITRTYSVRHFCPRTNELQVDFVLHGEGSPASGWADRVKPGDYLGIAGPGGPDPLLAPARHHVLVGDLTALPAIAALLEQLPADAEAMVFLWVPSEDKKILLVHPLAVRVCWLVSRQQECADCVTEAVCESLPASWKESLTAFVAGENAMVLRVRDYLREAFGLSKRTMYAVPYWRYGQDEETYHQERHRIMDQVY